MTLPDLPSDLPKPEPKEIDEKNHLELKYLAENALLRGQPSGEERCNNCLYYLEPEKSLSYCWHMKLRILVGDRWWCQWWQPRED
jgi:hypothetical protein